MNAQKSFFTHISEALDSYRAERRENEQDSKSTSGKTHKGTRLLRWLIPNGGTILLALLLILTQNVWAKPLQSALNAPGPSATTVNYQGRLADSSGNPKDGTFGMTFAFYESDTSGSPVWGPESHAAVPVSDGLFSVGLGSQTSGGIPTSVWNGDRYLEITVGGETLAPRELIRSVPVAGMALTVPDGAIEISGTYSAAISVSEGSYPTVSPNSIELSYKRIGSIVFISMPLFHLDLSGNPHHMAMSLPFPPETLNSGGSGTIGHPDGSVVGVIVENIISFRHYGDGYVSGPYRGGFWYIAASD